ncbi:MAG: aspartate aminotransferase family protein [Actinomycetota bacterium]
MRTETSSALAGVIPWITDLVIDRGEGSWVVDTGGRRYLDLSCGIAVTNVGHCHPRVVEAVERQVRTLMHTSVVAHHRPGIELADRLRTLAAPVIDDAQVFFCNSGAEAVDGAIKLARRTTGRPGIVAFRGAFHGRTMGATSLTTAKPKYQEGYAPLLPGVHVAPYGQPIQSLPDGVGMMIVEPVLGEGGYVVPPAGWLASLRRLCDEHGILLVFDEVQSGMGRTGAPFAAERLGVRPDVLLFAKGVASGLPLGGIIAPRSLMERWPTGAHGTTFGGNPVACAAALATLDVLEEEGLYERARALGERILTRLHGAGVEVRGLGLMVGVELADGTAAKRVQAACLADGVIVLTCGPGDNVIRLIPPLTITDDDLEHGLSVLCASLGA